jgi:hypothetical protein
MIVYAVMFCAGFLQGPMRCTVQPALSPRSYKECKTIVGKRQRSTGPAHVKLSNGLVAVRRWECVAKAGAEGEPAGARAGD